MKALAAARCTHQRRGSANYFLVGTVSVIKALCGGAAGADPSAQRGPRVSSQNRRQPPAHTLITSHFHTEHSQLCFPCGIPHFLVG